MYIKISKLVNVLGKITTKTPIYEMNVASLLRKIKRETPNLLTLTELDDSLGNRSLPYFEAELTSAGLKYLENLKEVPLENNRVS